MIFLLILTVAFWFFFVDRVNYGYWECVDEKGKRTYGPHHIVMTRYRWHKLKKSLRACRFSSEWKVHNSSEWKVNE